jgi:hypothetical protein
MKWIATITFIMSFHLANCQVLTRQYVENWVAKFNPKTKEKPITMYVIDGQYFSLDMPVKKDSVLRQLDSALHKLLYQDIAYIYGFTTDEVLPTTDNPGKVVALIATKNKERKKEKKHLLKEAIAKYNKSEIYYDHIGKDSKDPVLVIDDKLIYFKDCRKRLSGIRVKDIYAIELYSTPVPAEDYGENAKNGLIEIWIYPAKK